MLRFNNNTNVLSVEKVIYKSHLKQNTDINPYTSLIAKMYEIKQGNILYIQTVYLFRFRQSHVEEK